MNVLFTSAPQELSLVGLSHLEPSSVVPSNSSLHTSVQPLLPAAGSIVSAKVAAALAAPASVTVMTGEVVVAAVGVPEITPVLPFNVRPVGSEPAVTCQLYGGVPPLAASVLL